MRPGAPHGRCLYRRHTWRLACLTLIAVLACSAAPQVSAAKALPGKVIMGNGTNPAVYAALMSFYRNLNGDQWRENRNWNATGNPPNYCTFAGVQCNEKSQVMSL